MGENVFEKSKPKGDKEIMKGTIFRRLLTIVFLCLAAQIGVCAEDRAGEGELIRNMKTRMAEEGILFLREMDSGIAGIDPASGTLTIRDWNGKTTGTIRLSDCLDPVYECSGLLDCTDAADNGWAAVFSLDELSDHPMLALCRLSPDGQCLWSTVFEQQPQWGWTMLACDQAGGVFLVHVRDGSSRESVLRYFSSDGTMQWKKTLSFEVLVYSPFALESVQGNAVRLLGTAVSVSKGIYKAVELQLTSGADVISAAAWDFGRVTHDYAARLQLDRLNHTVDLYYVKEQGKGSNQAGISLEALETCDVPVFSLEDADASVQ
ncbi:MAG: hypothetical protein II141_03940 [Clostridia bacterium]|nr:hypothetical protein [Clostridia bacterium]